MRIIDLRSDTITHPTSSMRTAMAKAEVGDDVFGEDPTVNRLEKMAAERMGKEAALFVASGTMANIVSQLTHCFRGDEMILGDQSHIFCYEQGGSASLGGIHPRTVKNQPDGTLSIEDIEAVIRPDNVHFPKSRLIVVENTHNRCDGNPIDAPYMAAVRALADRHGLKIHVDGARIFNAAVALEKKPQDLTAHADSVSFCLSKGLASPVGSLVCGSNEFIARARRNRKVLGGGMRQAGILAASGIISITEMTDRLVEDHENAHRLAEGLSQIQGISIDPGRFRTNIVYFEIARKGLTPLELARQLEKEGVRVIPVGPRRIRAVTHYHITKKDVDLALVIVSRQMRASA
ncbi:MAG: threonine aldolase [Deltaproteobacteria bacterium RBG_13_49_15]|nr:MAG: threonine aldolase [Deltaproteobacteria bacterium RBG_13_49_15]